MSEFFYLNAESRPVGPLGEAELTNLFEAGLILEETMVAPAGSEEWAPFGKLIEQGDAHQNHTAATGVPDEADGGDCPESPVSQVPGGPPLPELEIETDEGERAGGRFLLRIVKSHPFGAIVVGLGLLVVLVAIGEQLGGSDSGTSDSGTVGVRERTFRGPGLTDAERQAIENATPTRPFEKACPICNGMGARLPSPLPALAAEGGYAADTERVCHDLWHMQRERADQYAATNLLRVQRNRSPETEQQLLVSSESRSKDVSEVYPIFL